jgi:hypothetical protein
MQHIFGRVVTDIEVIPKGHKVKAVRSFEISETAHLIMHCHIQEN